MSKHPWQKAQEPKSKQEIIERIMQSMELRRETYEHTLQLYATRLSNDIKEDPNDDPADWKKNQSFTALAA